jgi:hypothetical protein
MKSLVDQLPALIGVVLGAVGAMASASLTDRLRWRREQEVRWDQRRLEAYLTFASTLKEIHSLAFRLSATNRPGSHHPPIDREVAVELIAQANIRKTKDWESLLLLGDEGTVAAGRRWRDAVMQVERIARAESWDGSRWDSAVGEVDVARDRFHAAARRGLGVSGGSVEQSGFLRPRTLSRENGETSIELTGRS